MNHKTTVTLGVLSVGTFALLLGLVFANRGGDAKSATIKTLETELTPDKVTQITIAKGDKTLLELRRTPQSPLPAGERAKGEGNSGDWTLPGNWPTRTAEVNQVVNLLTGLRSRFATVRATDDNLDRYGLAKPTLVVTMLVGEKKYTLNFGETSNDENRFARPTYLRLNDNKELLRLAPGIIGVLGRPSEIYQQRRLFPKERIKQENTPDKVDQVAASQVHIESPAGKFTLRRSGEDWILAKTVEGQKDPIEDRADPDKVKNILTSIPDIWAEQFIDKSLADTGLDKPTDVLEVKTNGGNTLTLLLGKQSQMKTRTVTKPPPPGMPPQFPPRPTIETIHEPYRYAKLKDNDRIFEVKADEKKMKDLFVAADTLRDAKLARFSSFDVVKLEITRDGQTIVLTRDKDKGKWKMQKPAESDAEESKITELLDKLSALQATGESIIDQANVEPFGLDKPAATVTVAIEEAKGEGDAKKINKKSYTFTFGKRDEEKKKLYVRVDAWKRVNAVEDSLDALVKRPALAYKGRRILDFAFGDLAKLEVEHGKAKFCLEKDKEKWRLTAPEPAVADASKAGQLVADLARLEAVEYVTDSPKPEDLDKLYGLTKPSLLVAVTLSKKKEGNPESQRLVIGKQRPDKPEYFARLDGKPEVFVVKKEIVDTLDKGSMALLPQELWNVPSSQVAEVRVQKGNKEYHLKRDGLNWKIVAPFEANALPSVVEPVLRDLATLKSERYETQAAKELGKFGLDKPYLRLVLTTRDPAERKPDDKKDEKKDETKNKEHVILVGKPTAEKAKTRFAKLATGEAVFVVGEKFLAAAEKSPLELLDRLIFSADSKQITSIKTKTEAGEHTLAHKGDGWNLDSATAKFAADRDVMAGVLAYWSSLRIDRFVDYGPKVDLAKYGLDKPTTTLTITVSKPGEKEKDPPKTETHTLTLGKTIEKEAGARYGRIDQGPGVFVLSGSTVGELVHSYLDFADRTLLKLDASKVVKLERKQGDAVLEIEKKDARWQINKPQPYKADNNDVEDFAQQLGTLRASKVAGYQPKDLAPFGLATPVAVWSIFLAPDEKKPVLLKVGKRVKEDAPEEGRYVQAEGSVVVGVVTGPLLKKLTGSPLKFRDRTLAKFVDADKLILERGQRKATFAKVNGTWKLTSPTEADAESNELEDFINVLSTLRADEFVAEKPEDLSAYGLDKPDVHWSFRAGDKEVLGLSLGNAETVKDQPGPRHYAKINGSDIVFLLSARQTTLALAEYRSRTVWPTFDAVQADRIEFNYEDGPFTLEKVGQFWMAGEKKQALSPKVSETLDALARLKAERYVVDKDADLKLYGLEPPVLAVVVKTKSGNRVLHVGRAVGESKRRYACVGDGKHTDVFIISETDASRIVRDLPGFTKADTKPDVKPGE
jgi:hypothetical protein